MFREREKNRFGAQLKRIRIREGIRTAETNTTTVIPYYSVKASPLTQPKIKTEGIIKHQSHSHQSYIRPKKTPARRPISSSSPSLSLAPSCQLSTHTHLAVKCLSTNHNTSGRFSRSL